MTDRMLTRLKILLLALVALGGVFLMSGFATRAQRIVDAELLPRDFVGREHRALATGDRLVVEVAQIPGLNVVGLSAFEQDGSLYVYPRRISSGGGSTAQFEINVSKYRLSADWPQHVYWLTERYYGPFGLPRFWSSEKQLPWRRVKMEIVIR